MTACEARRLVEQHGAADNAARVLEWVKQAAARGETSVAVHARFMTTATRTKMRQLGYVLDIPKPRLNGWGVPVGEEFVTVTW